MVRTGPAGWSYRDWEGIVYPRPRPPGFDPLASLAGYFDTIEEMEKVYDQYKGHNGLEVTAAGWKLTK